MRIVVALGGNAMLRRGQAMTAEAQRENIAIAAAQLAPIAEGAGTIGLELGRMGEPPDAVLVPLGDGALVSGVGAWMRRASPGTRVIGVVAEGAPAMAVRPWGSGCRARS